MLLIVSTLASCSKELAGGGDISDSPPGMQKIIAAFEMTQKQNSSSDTFSTLQWGPGRISPVWSLSDASVNDSSVIASVPVISQHSFVFYQSPLKQGRKSAVLDSRCRLLVRRGAGENAYGFSLSWRIRRGTSCGLSEEKKNHLFNESFSGVEVVADMSGRISESRVFDKGSVSFAAGSGHPESDFVSTVMNGIGIARLDLNQTKAGNDTLDAAYCIDYYTGRRDTIIYIIVIADSLEIDLEFPPLVDPYDDSNCSDAGGGGGGGGTVRGTSEDSGGTNRDGDGSSSIKPNDGFSNLMQEKIIDVSKIDYPGIDNIPNCFNCAKYILSQAGISIGDYYKLYQELESNSNLPQSQRLTLSDSADPVTAANIIFNAIDNRRMIVAGVDYHPGNPGNDDHTTDHWIIIYGYEYLCDSGDYVFKYIETGRYKKQSSKAFNMELYYDVSEGYITGLKWNMRDIYWLTALRYSIY